MRALVRRMATRIGPQMQAVVSYVSRNPGCSKLAAALGAVQDKPGSRNMGYLYGPVNRALAAGLVVHKRGARRDRYYLFPASEPDAPAV